MAIGFIFAVIFAVITIGCVVVAIKKSGLVKVNGKASYPTKRDKNIAILSGVLAVAGIFGFVLIPASWHTVETGEVAVVKHLGEAKQVRKAGTYFDFWLTNKYSYYDSTVQTINIETSTYSKDAQTMDIALTVQYQINADNAIQIANTYGSLEHLSNRIESVSEERTKSILSSYSAMTIIETRASISPQVEEVIQATVSDSYYVTIVAAVLTNIDFSDEFEKTVEEKMIAEQEVLKAEYEKEKAIIAAEQQLEVAKLEAQAVVAQAEANAESVKLAADAQAQAIALKSVEIARMMGFNILERTTEDGITYEIDFTGKGADEVALITEYLKYAEYLAKWDGTLPTTYVVSDGAGASILIPVQ